MKISMDAIKALRSETGAPINDCKKALESAAGDLRKARAVLREQGLASAAKRSDRTAGEGRVESYVHHNGRMAALVEVNCETDFTARSEAFVAFCRDLAMHVAASNPSYLRREDAPEDIAASEKDVKETVLLEQPFVKDQGLTVAALLQDLTVQVKERIVIRRFARWGLGEESAN
jgi:elongation factor Ts